jgi:hypothetical protein
MSKVKARAKTGTARSKRARSAGRKPRKPLDLQQVRHQIDDLVGGCAVDMVETTIGEVDKGHYGAMKYLFEMIGLYPATGEERLPEENSLAKTLLQRLGLPEDPEPKPAATKESSPDAPAGMP